MKEIDNKLEEARRVPNSQLHPFFLSSKNGLENRVNDLGQINPLAEITSPNDMFKCMIPFLIFGKLIGVIRISGLISGNLDQLTFR